MPTLSAAERADLQSQVHTPSITGENTGDIYRNPAESGGKVGAPALAYASVSGRRRPASQDPRMMKLFPAALMNSGRVTHTLKVARTTDIRHGDEWHEAGVVYKVEGVGTWSGARLCALGEIKQEV